MKLLTRLAGLFGISLVLSCFNVGSSPTWPRSAFHYATSAPVFRRTEPASERDSDLVKDMPICIGSRSWSAGELGNTVLYRYERHGRTMHVGYFVYWTTERPWGDNALSYSLLPALFIDAFYSHLFFMFPGAQRFIHGPGDIEGARVVYEQRDDGRWAAVSAVADDGLHREVALAPSDFVDAEGRVVLVTEVWSHQLGAKGARAMTEKVKDSVVCFGGENLAPLTDDVARVFRLGSPSEPRRAPPAWRLDS